MMIELDAVRQPVLTKGIAETKVFVIEEARQLRRMSLTWYLIVFDATQRMKLNDGLSEELTDVLTAIAYMKFFDDRCRWLLCRLNDSEIVIALE